MKDIFLTILILSFCLIAACDGPQQKQVGLVESSAPDPFPIAGKVYQSVSCKENPQEKYALYLPESWTNEHSWPVIFWFDPEAKGDRPVEKYQELANNSGLIMLASNRSRNGMNWGEIQPLATLLKSEALQRYAADPERIYVGGFSGGARVATLLAMNDLTFKAVIGCGAGFPQGQPIQGHRFSWFGLVGDQDFNMLELQSLKTGLNQAKLKNHIHIYPGEHEWPPASEMSLGFQWLLLNPLRQGGMSNPQAAAIVDYEDNWKKRRKMNSENWTMVRFWLEKVDFLAGILDIQPFINNVQKASLDSKYQLLSKLEGEIFKEERKLQETYSQDFKTKDILYWRAEIDGLWKKSAEEDRTEKRKMNLRLLNFLSLYAYMYSNSAFGMNDLRGADRFLEIYRRVDPDNPEAFYQTASLRSKQGEMEETIKNLQKAGDLGFDDAARFHADPQFSGLQNAPVFGKIWEQFNLNKDKD